MAVMPQRLEGTGHAVRWRGEGGEEGKPMAMPTPDANTNKTFRGRSGMLKSGRPMNLGGSADRPAIRAKRRRK
jgi:hypothetical protein